MPSLAPCDVVVGDLGGLDEFHARQHLEAARWPVRAALQPPGPSS